MSKLLPVFWAVQIFLAGGMAIYSASAKRIDLAIINGALVIIGIVGLYMAARIRGWL